MPTYEYRCNAFMTQDPQSITGQAAALERLVASGRIHIEEQAQVQLARWFTAEEAEKLASTDC